MTQDRADELADAIKFVAENRMPETESYDASVRKDIRVSRIPGTTNVQIDMLYYNLVGHGKDSDMMSVNFAACLQQIENASAEHEASALRLIKQIVKAAMLGMEAPDV